MGNTYLSPTQELIGNSVVMQSIPETEIISAALVVVALVLVSSAVYLRRGSGTDKWNPSELNEDQTEVVELIKENDGEIPQKLVSDELEWSDAKTSRVTSELIDMNAVEKVRKDRQNHIAVKTDDKVEV